MENLYRYERDKCEEYATNKIRLCTYHIIRETPQGYWILLYNKKKWVSNSSKKRFAYPTKDEAYNGFIKRTERCVRILRAQLRIAEDMLTPEILTP